MNVTSAVPLASPHSNFFFNISSIGQSPGVPITSSTSRIRVLGLVVVAAAPNIFTLRRGGTNISPDFNLVAGIPLVIPFNEHGWFQTFPGEGLNFLLTAASQVAVHVHTIEISS
jgi:hypothetical protein